MAEYDTALVALIDKDLNATKDAGGINEPIMSIAGANGEGLKEFDLGRSAIDQSGLSLFKDRCGASRTKVSYYRLAPDTERRSTTDLVHSKIFNYVPGRILGAGGRLLYRHFG